MGSAEQELGLVESLDLQNASRRKNENPALPIELTRTDANRTAAESTNLLAGRCGENVPIWRERKISDLINSSLFCIAATYLALLTPHVVRRHLGTDRRP